MLWNEAVAGVHRDMKVFRQKVGARVLDALGSVHTRDLQIGDN